MQPIHMKRVLVLDAYQRSALAVTRSLGKQAVPVITADTTNSALAGSSRYSKKYFTYPSPQSQPEQFILAIDDICKKENIDIIMPMTELTSCLLLRHKDEIATTTLPFATIETVETLADKCTLMHLAESLDILTPKTWFADSPSSLPVELKSLTYPLVLKPGKSWVEYENVWLHTTVKIAKNAEQAEEILFSDPAYRAHPFMLQEFIPGSGGGVFALYNNGQPTIFFAHKRLREKPPRGGVSVLSESANLDPALVASARKLLDHVNWHGVAMVEFRITPEGTAYLMEINTRFWGSLQLGINAGVDFPWLLYQITCGQQVTPITNYKKGIRMRWMLGNVDWLYLILRDKEFLIKDKILALLAFLRPSPFKTRHEVIHYTDIKPFLWELKHYLKDLFKK